MDASGNFNHWFPNGIGMFTGSAYDTMTDVPADTSSTAANWPILNPVTSIGGATSYLTNANLQFTNTAGNGAWMRLNGSIQLNTGTGKYYWEATITNNSNSTSNTFGISPVSDTTASPSTNGYGITWNVPGFGLFPSGSVSGTPAIGDVLMLAYDSGTGSLWIGRNGSWLSGNPSTGTSPSFTGITGNWVPCIGTYTNASSSAGMAANFGQQPFAYALPTGYATMNTFNVPVYTAWWGNGNTYPDFTWIKSRSAATYNMLMDTLRGPSLYLNSDTINPQYGSGGAYNWSKYGLVLANDGNTNVSGNTYVLWGWSAGQGNATINGSGSITSTVSANPTAGFSIVSYTGNGVSGATVGHGLGVAPSFIMVRNLTTLAQDWAVYSAALGATQYLNLDNSNSAGTTSATWNNTPPTSAVFTIGPSSITGANAANYIAYCWTAVSGYSAFGSYTGNGSTDGPFIYTGFRPRWIMYKSATESSYWNIFDTARSTYNVDGPYLNPNVNSAEGSTTLIDILSNGFKLRTSSSGNNTSSATYIYAAFAENPFKYALAR